MKVLQPGTYCAVRHSHEWHIAQWDGSAFEVVSNLQSGDRWLPEWVDTVVSLPDED